MKRVFHIRNVMIFFTLFVGVGAVAGSVGMFMAPDGSILGMDTMLKYFQVLPFADKLFQNYIFSGIALLIVNGISNLTAAICLFRFKKSGPRLSCLFGFTLMLWITIQFVIFPPNVLSISFFIIGFVQFCCGLYLIVLVKQNEFKFDLNEYNHINSKHDTIVVYFSRTGYCKKVAYEKADELGCDILELKTPNRTNGFLGFAWLGRFSMHRWAMPIDKVDLNLAEYEKVIIVSPVHDFSLASPVREFCKNESGKIKNAEYIILHFMRGVDFTNVFDEMDSLLKINAEKKTSIVCHYGNEIKKKNIEVA